MKYILTFLMLPLLINCANSVDPLIPKISLEEATSLKEKLKEGFKPENAEKSIGVNYMYRYGYYIYALYKHSILTYDDAQEFCDVLPLLIDYEKKGFHSLPNWRKVKYDKNRIMSRDDYQGLIFGLSFAKSENNCPQQYIELMNRWFDNKEGPDLNGSDIWSPIHEVCFERAEGKDHTHYITWDFIGYKISTEPTCKKGNLSDKILIRACQIIASHNYPTYWSNESNNYCKRHNNYNELVEKYYNNENNRPFNQIYMKDILKDIL